MAATLYKWYIVAFFSLLPGVDMRWSLMGLPGADGLRAAIDGGGPHPLYISVTEISHNPKEKILEISCKIFTNDFEAVLEKMTKSRVDLSSVKDKAATDKLIEEYIGRHLRLKVDGKVGILHFIGSEKESDGTWSYFQINEVPSVKKIDVSNDLLYDGFNQQINIMHVTVGGDRKSTRLDYPEANASFQV